MATLSKKRVSWVSVSEMVTEQEAVNPRAEITRARKAQKNVLKGAMLLMRLESKLRCAEERSSVEGARLLATTKDGDKVNISRETLNEYKKGWKDHAVLAMHMMDAANEWEKQEFCSDTDDGDPGLITRITARELGVESRKCSISLILASLDLESAKSGSPVSRGRVRLSSRAAVYLGLEEVSTVNEVRASLRRYFRRVDPALSRTARCRYLGRLKKGEVGMSAALGALRLEESDEHRLKSLSPALW